MHNPNQKISMKEIVSVFNAISNQNTSSYLYGKQDSEALAANRFSGLLIDVIESGNSGGNCWGGDAVYFRTASSDILNELQNRICYFLEKIVCNKNVAKELAKILAKASYNNGAIDNYIHLEYYGNDTNYAVYLVPFQKIFEQLQALHLVPKELSYLTVSSELDAAFKPEKEKIQKEKLNTELREAQERKRVLQSSDYSSQTKNKLLKTIELQKKALEEAQAELGSFEFKLKSSLAELESKIREIEEKLKGIG